MSKSTSSASSDMAIRLEGVTKRFGRQIAVRDLSLEVPKGTVLGFLGPNGAGKTTAIKMLMGLLTRDGGEISVLGIDPAVDALSVKQRVGYVPEEHFIYRWMRVREAVGFCRSVYSAWNDKWCTELLKLFELDAEKKVRHLSKGMVVKLSLVLALSHEPELLILDEPMAGLDPVAREELLDGVLQAICDKGHTVIFSSHTLSDVQRLADTIGIINEGKLLVHSDVDALLGSTKRIRAILANGCTPGGVPEGLIWQRVRGREWLLTVKDFSADKLESLRRANRLEQVEVIDLGLEDIFKDYVRGWRASP